MFKFYAVWLVIREIKHHPLRQTAIVSLWQILLLQFSKITK